MAIVILIGEEPHPPYERPPLSKQYLRGEVPFEKALVRPDGFYEDNRIDARFGVAATRVDPAERKVELTNGQIGPLRQTLDRDWRTQPSTPDTWTGPAEHLRSPLRRRRRCPPHCRLCLATKQP